MACILDARSCYCRITVFWFSCDIVKPESSSKAIKRQLCTELKVLKILVLMINLLLQFNQPTLYVMICGWGERSVENDEWMKRVSFFNSRLQKLSSFSRTQMRTEAVLEQRCDLMHLRLGNMFEFARYKHIFVLANVFCLQIPETTAPFWMFANYQTLLNCGKIRNKSPICCVFAVAWSEAIGPTLGDQLPFCHSLPWESPCGQSGACQVHHHCGSCACPERWWGLCDHVHRGAAATSGTSQSWDCHSKTRLKWCPGFQQPSHEQIGNQARDSGDSLWTEGTWSRARHGTSYF